MTIKSSQRALALCPHPDDESLGCGGTLKLISSSGGEVDVLYLTCGENGSFPGDSLSPKRREEIAARRKDEALRACRILGTRNVFFAGGRDGSLQTQLGLSEFILRTLNAQEYRSVFCPWPYDAHTDHTATYAMLHEALRHYTKNIDVWLYEIWSPLTHNICIAIDATIEAKIEAFRSHESQAAIFNYAEAFYGLARYRSLFCPPAKFAEAFFNCDRAALINHDNVPWPRLQLPAAL